MDIRDVAIDEAGCLAHALGGPLRDRLDEFKAECGMTVNEVVVGSKLKRRVSILAVEIVGVDIVDKLERVLTELFLVANGFSVLVRALP